MKENLEELTLNRSPEGQTYWDGLLDEKLLLQRCTNCNKLRHYPRPMCDACHSLDYDWIASSCKGSIYTWSVSHHPFHPAFKDQIPYVMITAQLEEPVRLLAPLVKHQQEEKLYIGRTLTVAFLKISDTLCTPYFILDKE